MQPLQAVVKNGRLTLDEPTELPDGRVVVLLPLEQLLAAADELGPGELGLPDFADGDGDGDGDAGPPAFSFVLGPRMWKRPAPVDAKALLDELRGM